MTKDKPKEGARRAVTDIEIGLNGLVGALGEALSEITDRLMDGQSGEIHRAHEFRTEKGPMRAEAGVRVRMGGLGAAAAPAPGAPARRRADAGARSAGSADPAPAPRPIGYDIWEEAGTWRLTADLPGVAEEDLSIGDGEGTLVLATSGARRYAAEIPFPEGRSARELSVTLRNGILDLALPPRKEPVE